MTTWTLKKVLAYQDEHDGKNPPEIQKISDEWDKRDAEEKAAQEASKVERKKVEKTEVIEEIAEEQEDIEYYFKVPEWVVKDKKLSPNKKYIYSFILSMNRKEKTFWASNEHIAEKIGIDPKSVQNMLNGLEKDGYIERKLFREKGGYRVEKRYITAITKSKESNNEI